MRVALLILGLAWNATRLSAQETPPRNPIRLNGDATCASCRIELVPVVTLGQESDELGPERFAKVVRDRMGRYYVAPTYVEGRIAVYDNRGRFARAAGQPGGGPGELRLVSWMLAANDSIHIYHQLRHAVLSPDGAIRHVRTLPGPVHAAVRLTDGRIAVNADFTTRNAAGYPLHILDGRDSVVHSFGLDPVRLRDGVRRFRLTPGENGAFWAADSEEYRIELWSEAGVLVKAIERRIAWLERAQTYHPQRRPVLRAIALDNGLLWVVFTVPNADVRDEPIVWGERPVLPFGELAKQYHAVVEVIDPEAMEVVATAELPRTIASFIAGGVVYGLREEDSGNLVVDVWELRLRR